jgi:serine protease AprX
MRDQRSSLIKPFLAGIVLFVAMVLPVTADPGGSRPARAHGRLAPDLQTTLQQTAPGRNVRLVVNLDDAADGKVIDRIRELGGVVRGQFRNTRQVAFDLPAAAVPGLVDIEGIDYVAPDRPVQGLVSHLETTTGASQAYVPTTLLSSLLSGGSLTGTTGVGVTVAVIDSGIDTDHFDLRDGGTRRVLLSVDFTGHGDPSDPYGHGTHVAGIIAGNGRSYQNNGLDYAGIAPAANLLNLKALDAQGHGYLSDVIAAVDFAVGNKDAYNIRVVNMSLAAPPIESYRDDPLCHAVERASRAGLVVVVSAGNYGLDTLGQKVYGGITSPAISPAVITVGATRTFGTDVRSDDQIAPFSSRGPTRSRSIDPVTGATVYDNLPKPDLVAPGVRVVSLERPDNALVTAYPSLHVDTGSSNTKSGYMVLSGTSMSSAVVAGTVALMLQANPGLTPNMVKAILMYSAQVMNGPDLFEQGAGELNAEGAVRMALALSQRAGSLLTGQKLLTYAAPQPSTRIAGESFTWTQSLIWGNSLIWGSGVLGTMQGTYAQALIWGGGAWGAGCVLGEGTFADDHVVYGQSGTWRYIWWSDPIALAGGLLFRDDLSTSGVLWTNRLITEDFFSIDPSSLIWGIARYGYDLSLIWGNSTADGSALIWGAL